MNTTFSSRSGLVVFAVLVITLRTSFASSDVCLDGSCGGASGTVLLSLNTNTKKVTFQTPEVATPNEEEDSRPGGVSLSETVRTRRMEAERMKAMATLEYDSDGDDISAALEIADADLEFTDQDDSADDFHEYVAKHGYSEIDDARFSPSVWTSAPDLRASHNCYMYALNDLSPRSSANCKETQRQAEAGLLNVGKRDMPKICKRYFHKPGYYFQNVVSGRVKTDVWFREETTCRLMLPMIASDSPAIVWNNEKNTSLTEADNCPDNHYMAALFIHPKAGFHFYRRDHRCHDTPSELCWSHKPGILKATDVDASGNKIRRVLEANRNYGELNYSEHCAFFCVPQNGAARTHSDSRKTLVQSHQAARMKSKVAL